MDRETKTITTPVDKHKVVLKAWITGKEKRELRRVFLEKTNIPTSGQVTDVKLNAAEVIENAENKAIEVIVVSIDEDSKNILTKILDMKGNDYDFVVKEINKISRETDFLG